MKEENHDFDLCSNDNGDDISDHGTDKSSGVFKSRYRSPTFSTKETNYLLHCIMAEKQYINNLKNDTVSRQDRDRAWHRVAKMYNKKFSNAPRNAKMLRTKYMNYKKKVFRTSSNDGPRNKSKLVNINDELDAAVKIERDDLDGSNQSAATFFEASNNLEILFDKEIGAKTDTSSDPLSAVLNGFTNTVENKESVSMREDPNVVKLKIELLNYQLETAKMERERVRSALEAEAAERRKRDELLDLQIREAQLKASLAERQLTNQYPLTSNAHYHVP